MQKEYVFDAADAAEKCIQWLRDWFDENGKGCNAILGISGGKDSSVTAALCARALGKDRVIGVLMPQGEQPDIDYSKELVEFLGIRNYTVNVGKAISDLLEATDEAVKASESEPFEISVPAKTNLPPRVRMSVLYLVGASNNGRVINTCNLSEDWVGYATRYGDGAGDVGPISNFTVEEVREIGRYLGLPEKFIIKPPSDGLCGKTDEDNLGFTYKEVDDYIRRGIEPEHKERIDYLHKLNLFKLSYMPTFKYFE
ncbi:MAG: NAD(+) synthase [Oscillospiraceae bacterium]|nr:NAD(+) synthase [Candidatus Limimonas coprohippi]MCQ2488180.1 NAD(+) synthase [Clostridia bacterium]